MQKDIHGTFSDTFSMENWLEDTFGGVPDTVSGLEWCNSDPSVPTLPTLFLIKSSSGEQRVSADLVLRVHHDIIDGISNFVLFNNPFSNAALAY